MERNALSTIIEEIETLDLGAYCDDYLTSPCIDEEEEEVGDDDEDEEEQWPQAPTADECLQMMQLQNDANNSVSEEAAPISSAILSGNKPKSAKDAAAYIKEKYEALNRLRQEAGFGNGISVTNGSPFTESHGYVESSRYGHYNVNAAENGYERPHVPTTLPLQAFHYNGVAHPPIQVSSPASGSVDVTPLTSPVIHTHQQQQSIMMQSPSPSQYDCRSNGGHCCSCMEHRCDCGDPTCTGNQGPMLTSALRLSEQTIAQVELFYRSHKSEVFVCPCYTHLYYGVTVNPPTVANGGQGAKTSIFRSKNGGSHHQIEHLVAFPRDWTYARTGVAVLLLDTGDNSRRTKRLSIILAELGTGFALWRDSFSCYTNYHAVQANFHVMRLSHDHARFVGLAFEDAPSAGEFLQRIREFVAKSAIGNGDVNSPRQKSAKKPKKSRKAPTKADISSPCCFSHVTKLDHLDGMQLLGQPAAVAMQRQLQQQTIVVCQNKTADIGTRFIVKR